MEKKKRKLNIKKFLFGLLTIFFASMFIYSGWKILGWLKDNKDNRELKKKTEESITVKPDEPDEKKYDIDFTALKAHNPNTVAYLNVKGTNIDYVVVRGKDNSYYLRRTFDRTWNASGWIFADYRNDFDGTDKNIIIYGHNTKDGSMFGSLKNTLTEEWRSNKENRQIVLVTEQGTFLYEVFSTYTRNPEEYYITTYFGNIDFNGFVNELASRSNFDYGVDLSNVSQILTLSTCSDDLAGRVIVHAKLINNGEENNEN